MKTKIVLWGSNEKNEKLLIAIELLEKENKVRLHTFDAEQTTEEFYNQMMNLWRNDGDVIFPDHHQLIERELSLSESLLPDDIKVERSDLINRAKTEWHFVVLSAKLHESYRDEIREFRERIEQLNQFDSVIWEEMKTFWNKVQGQVREKTLFKEHADGLRNATNELFSHMKEFKRSMEEEFGQFSKERVEKFMNQLEEIEEKIEEGMGLQPLFNQLKDIQKIFRETQFTRADRSKVWKKLDGAFKKVKEKKFGTRSSDKSTFDRITRRYNGLIAAIEKMKKSINRDKKEMDFQSIKIETTNGQLEMQIRQAKLSMISERILSKEEKLKEMLITKEELERRLENEKQKTESKKTEEEAQKKKVAATSESESENETGESQTETESAVETEKESEAAKGNRSEDEEGESTSETVSTDPEEVIDTDKKATEVVVEDVEALPEPVARDEEE